jgi:hypothetical protein
MPAFELATPDGQKYRIEAADGDAARAAFDSVFNPPPPGVMIHEPGRSYIAQEPGATTPPLSVDTSGRASGVGMGAAPSRAGLPNREEAAAALAMRQRGDTGAIIPATLQPFVQGATMNYGDELASAAAGLGNLVRGGAFDKAYNLAQEAQRQDLAQTRQENPISSTASQVIGSLTTAPLAGALGLGRVAAGGASLASRILGGAGIGAGYGVVSGFGEGSGLEDRLAKTIPGAATGMVVGGAIPLAGEVVRRGTNTLLDYININRNLRDIGLDPPAGRLAMRNLEADDAFTGAGRQNIALAGPEGMLADAGPSTRGLLDTVIQSGGGGSRAAQQSVEQRGAAAHQTLMDTLDTALGGPPQGVGAQTAAIRQGGQAARGTSYQDAYAAPIDYSTQAGQNLESLIRNRVPADVIAAANAKMRIRGEPPSAQIRVTVDADGNAVFDRLPDVRQIDYITRGLRERAESPDVVGALGGRTSRAADYLDLAARIRGTARSLVPEYGAALDTAADDIGRVQATRLGADILSPAVTRDEVAQSLARHQTSAAEMEAVRRGARAQIDDIMAKTRAAATDPNQDARETANILRNLNSRETQDKLDMIVTDPLVQAQMRAQIDQASRAIQLRTDMTTNSKTFARTTQRQATQEMLEPGPLGAAARGRPINALQRGVQALTGRTPAYDLSREDAMNRQLAELLTVARGPQAQRQLDTLQQAYTVAPQNAARAQQYGEAAGVFGGIPGYPLLRGLLGY